MRSSILALTILTLTGLVTSKASADPATLARPRAGSAPTAPTPRAQSALASSPAADASGNCTDAFVDLYTRAQNEIDTFAGFLKASPQQTPENLSEAMHACRALMASFAGAVCNAPGDKPGTVTQAKADSMNAPCGKVAQRAAAVGFALPSGPIGDASALADAAPERLSLTIGDANTLQAVLNQPRKVFIISGQEQSFSQALASDTMVRCVLAPVQDGQQLTLRAGATYTASQIAENFISENRALVIHFGSGADALSLECENETGSGLTLGALKGALGGLAQLNYQN